MLGRQLSQKSQSAQSGPPQCRQWHTGHGSPRLWSQDTVAQSLYSLGAPETAAGLCTLVSVLLYSVVASLVGTSKSKQPVCIHFHLAKRPGSLQKRLLSPLYEYGILGSEGHRSISLIQCSSWTTKEN